MSPLFFSSANHCCSGFSGRAFVAPGAGFCFACAPFLAGLVVLVVDDVTVLLDVVVDDVAVLLDVVVLVVVHDVAVVMPAADHVGHDASASGMGA